MSALTDNDTRLLYRHQLRIHNKGCHCSFVVKTSQGLCCVQEEVLYKQKATNAGRTLLNSFVCEIVVVRRHGKLLPKPARSDPLR